MARQPKPYTIIEYNGRQARQYEDGAIRNERGHPLALPPNLQNHAITPDTAHDMLAARKAKRVRLATEGAMLGVADAGLIAKYGNDAAFVERARTLQTVASTPDAGKAMVMATQYMDKLQGYVEDPKEAQTAVDSPINLALVQLLGAITQRLAQTDVIPIRQITEADSE